MDPKDLANNMLPSFVEILMGAPIYMLARRYRIKEPTAAFLIGLVGAAICVATILISGRPNAWKIVIQSSVITAALILWFHVLYGTWKHAGGLASAKGNDEAKNDLGSAEDSTGMVQNGPLLPSPNGSADHPSVVARIESLAGQNGNGNLVIHLASWEAVDRTGERYDVTPIVRQHMHKDQNGRIRVDMEVTRQKLGDPSREHQKELVVTYSGVKKIPEWTPAHWLRLLEEGAPTPEASPVVAATSPTPALGSIKTAFGTMDARAWGRFRMISFQYKELGQAQRFRCVCWVDFYRFTDGPASPSELLLMTPRAEHELCRLRVPNGYDKTTNFGVPYEGEGDWQALIGAIENTMLPDLIGNESRPWRTHPPSKPLYCDLEVRLPDGGPGDEHAKSNVKLEFEMAHRDGRKIRARIDPWRALADPPESITEL